MRERNADFHVCCVAGFLTCGAVACNHGFYPFAGGRNGGRPADLEIRDRLRHSATPELWPLLLAVPFAMLKSAGLEVCATSFPHSRQWL